MVELATKADLLATEQKLQTELRTTEQRLQTAIETLKETVTLRLTVRLGAMLVIAIGALATILKLV